MTNYNSQIVFTDEEKARIDEIKKNYQINAGQLASPKGLADHVWKHLLDNEALIVRLRDVVNEAYEENRKSVVAVSNRLVHKYTQELALKDKQISNMQNQLAKLASKYGGVDSKVKQNTDSVCSGCGSKNGCYCK
ncbi:hypothetical protein ACOCGL_003716 [Vibrio cholerae]